MRTNSVAADDPQLRSVLLSLKDRRLPRPWQILEVVRIEQRLVELAALIGAHLDQRRLADDPADPAAELRARHWQRVNRSHAAARTG
jgi:hypothetical protein